MHALQRMCSLVMSLSLLDLHSHDVIKRNVLNKRRLTVFKLHSEFLEGKISTCFSRHTLTTGFVIRYYQPNRDVFLHTNN